MAALALVYHDHPFWIWLLAGVIMLAIEAASGSGWMLWPAAAAMIVALVSLTGVRLGLAPELGLFAVLTLLTTVLARRFLVRPAAAASDVNNPEARLIGKLGVARTAFTNGQGRVFVNGAEWPADLEGTHAPESGARIEVVAVEGSKLTVRPVGRG